MYISFFQFTFILTIYYLISCSNEYSNYYKKVSLNSIDYLNNGDFSMNTCPIADTWCIWYFPTYSYQISYWQITDSIQMGTASQYNSRLNTYTKKVIQLDSQSAKCMYQNVSAIPSGIYNLTYTYCLRQGIPYDWVSLTMYINNSIVQQIIHSDYQIHTNTTQVINSVNGSDVQIKFCALGPGVWDHGVVLINASFSKVAQIPALVINNSITNNSIVNNSIINNSIINNSIINDPIKSSNLFGNAINIILESQSLQIINKIPANRRIFNQILGFFVNLDHLWLYIYHQRNYADPIKKLLSAINNLQNQKWEPFSNQLIQDKFGINSTQIRQRIDFKKQYSSISFVNIENSGSTFFPNSTHFFLMNITLVLIIFIMGKVIYKTTANYKLSALFKQFSFNLNIVLILLEGNIQSFSYYFTSDCLKLFSFNLIVKISNILTLCFYFNFLFLTIAGYFLLLAFYPKKSQHIYNNCKVNKRSCVCLFVSYGLVNLALGMIHIILQKDSDMQLFALCIVEICYCITMMVQISNKKQIFEHKYLVWINIWASFIRIMLIFTHLWFNIQNTDSILIFTDIQQLLIMIYLGLMVISMLISIIILISSVRKIFWLSNNIQEQVKKQNKIYEQLNVVLAINYSSIQKNQKFNKKYNKTHQKDSQHHQISIQKIKNSRKLKFNFKLTGKNNRKIIRYSHNQDQKNQLNIKKSTKNQANTKLFPSKQNSQRQKVSLNQYKNLIKNKNSFEGMKINYRDHKQDKEKQNNDIQQIMDKLFFQNLKNQTKIQKKQVHNKILRYKYKRFQLKKQIQNFG